MKPNYIGYNNAFLSKYIFACYLKTLTKLISPGFITEFYGIPQFTPASGLVLLRFLLDFHLHLSTSVIYWIFLLFIFYVAALTRVCSLQLPGIIRSQNEQKYKCYRCSYNHCSTERNSEGNHLGILIEFVILTILIKERKWNNVFRLILKTRAAEGIIL